MERLSLMFLFTLLVYAEVAPKANACSLLPDGTTKCFKSEIDYTKNNEKGEIEITYTLYDAMILKYKVNENGRELRFGLPLKEKIGDDKSLVQCDEITDSEKQEKIYSGIKSDIFDYKMKRASTIEDHFILVKKEFWECSSVKGHFKFIRVVRELISKDSELKNIYHFDDVEIKTVVQPFEENQQIKINIPILREVKYVALNDYSKSLIYRGKLKFNQPESDFSYFKPIQTSKDGVEELNLKNTFGDDFHKEVVFMQNEELKHVKISRNGNHFTNLQEHSTKLESSQAKYECKLNVDDKRPFLKKYLPKWKKGENYEMDSDDFLKYFTVTEDEFWECSQTGKYHGVFERRLIEYIAKVPIDTIEFYDGSKVWEYDLDATSKSVAVRTIYYFNKDEPLQNLKYQGEVKLIEPTKKKPGVMQRVHNTLSLDSSEVRIFISQLSMTDPLTKEYRRNNVDLPDI